MRSAPFFVRSRSLRSFFLIAFAIFLICRYYLSLSPPIRQPRGRPPYHRKAIPFIKSSFDWSQHHHAHPVSEADMSAPPRERPYRMPPVQYHFPRSAYVTDAERERRRMAVRDAFVRCWDAYKAHAWLYDELTPNTLKGKDPYGGWAATMVDALDTLAIMELWSEFSASLPAVAALDWNSTKDTAINVFETTIRHLGGLLSAYDLSGERVLLLKAVELGDMLYAAFDTPNRIPPFWLSFDAAKRGTLRAGTHDPSASPCSLSLEFTRLSQVTGDPKYYDAIDRIKRFLQRTQHTTKLPGLWPIVLDFANERADRTGEFSLGALADSLYEYLPKMFALLGGHDSAYEYMYRDAMTVVEEHLLFRPMVPDDADILFSGKAYVQEKDGVVTGVHHVAEGQHLTCFVGGMFALGGKLFGIKRHVGLGERLARGCAWAYSVFPSGIMPEIFGMVPCASLDGCPWNETRWQAEGNAGPRKGFANVRDPRYILRPEAIESVFLLYRMTGKREFQEVAWTMFQAIQEATQTEFANSAIKDVTVPADQTEKLDSMESFWMAETLKYFYLIFSPPDVISLDEFVLNTEAHPFRRP